MVHIRIVKGVVIFVCSLLFFSFSFPLYHRVTAQHLLTIDAPSSVGAGENFNITITVNGIPVIAARVTFDEVTHQTGINGKARFTAPQVDSDTTFPIVANKSGYTDGTSSILVTNSASPEQPQLHIQAPSEVEEEHTFTVLITANGIPIPDVTVTFLGRFFSTDENGLITLNTPSVSENTSYFIGANKTGYRPVDTWILILNNVTKPELALVIDGPSQITAGQTFVIEVTANDIPIVGAAISFHNELFTTDGLGQVQLIAPTVTEDTDLPLLATKTGYQPATFTIRIIPIEIFKGWVYGMVTDTLDRPLHLANVCLILSQTTEITISQCVLTSSDGFYLIEVTPGTYNLSASKDGYLPESLDSINVLSNTSLEINLQLAVQPSSSEPPQSPKEPMQYTISYGIQNEIVGAVIALPQEQQTQISIFKPGIDIMVLPSQQPGRLTFSITGQDHLNGTVVALEIADNASFFEMPFSSIKDFQVIYDGVLLSPASAIEEVLSSSPQSHASWIGVITSSHAYILLNFPEFSTHSVSIIPLQQVVESIGGFTALLIYLAFIIIGALIFIGIGEFSDRP